MNDINIIEKLLASIDTEKEYEYKDMPFTFVDTDNYLNSEAHTSYREEVKNAAEDGVIAKGKILPFAIDDAGNTYLFEPKNDNIFVLYHDEPYSGPVFNERVTFLDNREMFFSKMKSVSISEERDSFLDTLSIEDVFNAKEKHK